MNILSRTALIGILLVFSVTLTSGCMIEKGSPAAAPAEPAPLSSGQPSKPVEEISPAPSHPDEAERQPGRNVSFQVRVEGLERDGLLHIPTGYDSAEIYPLLVFLHGTGASAEAAMEQTRLADLADRENFLVAFANGTEAPGDPVGLSWDAWDCCGYAFHNQVDDVAFLQALFQTLQDRYAVDPKRIYLVGFSNGAAMALRFAVERTSLLAGVAAVSGHIRGIRPSLEPETPLSVIIIHGRQDRVVPYKGKKPSSDSTPAPDSAEFNANFWASHNGCSMTPETTVRENAEIQRFTGGRQGTAVVLWTIADGGHAWPGGEMKKYRYCNLPTATPDASKIIWGFLKQFEKSSATN